MILSSLLIHVGELRLSVKYSVLVRLISHNHFSLALCKAKYTHVGFEKPISVMFFSFII